MMSILGENGKNLPGCQNCFWKYPVGEIEFSGLSNVLILWISLPPKLANIQRKFV